MTTQPDIEKRILPKPVKIIIAALVLLLTLLGIGIIKDVPVYEVHKEVSL